MDRLRTSVVLPWIVAVVGFPIGGFLGQAIAGPASTVPSALLSGVIAGLIIGGCQALALGLPAQALATWTVGTAASLGVALTIVTAAIGQIESTTEAVGLGVLSGVLIGGVQGALFTRAHVAHAWIWIVASLFAWGVGWLITASVGVALAPGWPVYGLSGAVVSQIVTGIALWRLVPSRDRLRAAT
jgi:hypothetical protein